jgi:hypothetical protein
MLKAHAPSFTNTPVDENVSAATINGRIARNVSARNQLIGRIKDINIGGLVARLNCSHPFDGRHDHAIRLDTIDINE